jgi:hypothetical protein
VSVQSFSALVLLVCVLEMTMLFLAFKVLFTAIPHF